MMKEAYAQSIVNIFAINPNFLLLFHIIFIIWSREKEGWNKDSCINIWQYHFYFLLLSRHLQVAQLVWASEPIEFGSAFVSIYGRASSCALFLTSRNLDNFLCLSELSNGRCSCSVYAWFYARKADYSKWFAIMCCRWLYKLHCVGSALPVQQTRVVQNLKLWNRQVSGSTLFYL